MAATGPRRCATPLGVVLVSAVLMTAAPLLAADFGSEAQREAGRVLYDKYCAQCHDESGDGTGYAANRVKPKPRDFTSGKYKFRSTPSGRLPTDVDLRKVIVEGLPYTSMPGWPNFTPQQVQNLIYYLKTFSSDFENPDMEGEPITIPPMLEMTEESLARGRQIYEELGCEACHGKGGRGDGPSAPTLEDDWGNHIRPADMTMRWTFRGGGTRQDIFRTFSTGLNGTPMPSYADSLGEEDRLHLTNYIYSLSSDEPGYANLLLADYVDEELDLERGAELFAEAPAARFPLVGQIVEPGRNFYPSASSVLVQAVYNPREIAFRVRWNDMRAEQSGVNSPALEVPIWEVEQPDGSAAEGEGDFFGGLEQEEEAGFWGEAEETEEEGFWGEPEAEEEAGFWGEAEAAEGDDFFGEAEDDFFGEAQQAAGPSGPDWEFSDAVALQFPSQLPSGNRKPYFIYGDTQSPVDLWFTDLGRQLGQLFTARGAELIEPSDAEEIQVTSSFADGEWSVIFKRELRSATSISFGEGQFTPIAFSVWDGFNRERGNKRALSSWFYVYNEPAEVVSPLAPMLRTAGLVLGVELLVIYLVRRRFASSAADSSGELAAGSGSPVSEGAV